MFLLLLSLNCEFVLFMLNYESLTIYAYMHILDYGDIEGKEILRGAL
jgi:hypothetical protein